MSNIRTTSSRHRKRSSRRCEEKHFSSSSFDCRFNVTMDRTPDGQRHSVRVTQYSSPHSLIPLRYIEPWRRDIVNRELIVNNAHQSNIPHYEHDDALYFNKREQMHYNVEPRERVDKKYQLPSRSDQLQPRVYEIYDRYRSSLLSRFDPAQRFQQVPK